MFWDTLPPPGSVGAPVPYYTSDPVRPLWPSSSDWRICADTLGLVPDVTTSSDRGVCDAFSSSSSRTAVWDDRGAAGPLPPVARDASSVQHLSALPLSVATLTFEPIRPTVVRPSSADTVPVSSAPSTEATSVITEAATSSAPHTSSAAPTTSPVTPTVSTDDFDDDPNRFIAAPSQSTPSSTPQE